MPLRAGPVGPGARRAAARERRAPPRPAVKLRVGRRLLWQRSPVDWHVSGDVPFDPGLRAALADMPIFSHFATPVITWNGFPWRELVEHVLVSACEEAGVAPDTEDRLEDAPDAAVDEVNRASAERTAMVGTVRAESAMRATVSSSRSGTGTRPTLGSTEQNG